MNLFQPTLESIIDVLALDQRLEACAAEVEATKRYLLNLHTRLPDHVRCAFWCATIAFSLSSVPFRGRPFHRLGRTIRADQVERWRRSRLSAKRDFIRYFNSLVVFSCFEERFNG